MKHDYRRRRWPARLSRGIWDMLAQWRQRRLARQAFTEISARKNAHLFDDIGLDGADAGRDAADGAGRHRFWML
ncbi:hypothetical protein [Pararhizobium qamdonense]|uniref:hypothetical protein n=1 Tax=Pararhizobium qamdonense TaxID=3031126 RepID=UPI0023E12830|nr:hypothetical protein [Pararhizobium qamdonense]